MPQFTSFKFAQMDPQPDTTYALGWTVDIYSSTGTTTEIIYHDCALTTLISASYLFERLALYEISKPRGYGSETKISYVLPKGIAGAAFIRVLHWIYAINEASEHGEVEDPQITTFEGDGLVQFLRLYQVAELLELKKPIGNQKRLPELIKNALKKGFDTKGNKFKDIRIEDREIGLVWDVGGRDRNEPITKLMLCLIVDAMDVRKENKSIKDGFNERIETLMGKNAEFRSAVIDVKTKKNVRLREEARERRGEPKTAISYGKKKSPNPKKKENVASSDWDARWERRELTEPMVKALMGRPEEFRVQSPKKCARSYEYYIGEHYEGSDYEDETYEDEQYGGENYGYEGEYYE